MAELQLHLAKSESNEAVKAKSLSEYDAETIAETKAALEAERSGTARLERALAAALADNATLAARLHVVDNTPTSSQPAKQVESSNSTNICPIDDFLAD